MGRQIDFNKAHFLDKVEADPDGFVLLDEGALPCGLTSQTLFDIWDIAVKFGHFVPAGLKFDGGGLSIQIYDMRGTIFMVIGTRQHFGDELLDTIRLDLLNDLYVLVHSSVFVGHFELSEWVRRMDKEWWASRENGQRKVVGDIKLVAEFFSRANFCLVQGNQDDLDKLLNSFDRPEDVAQTAFTGYYILCLRENQHKVEMLQRAGIDFWELVHMPSEEAVRHLEEKLADVSILELI